MAVVLGGQATYQIELEPLGMTIGGIIEDGPPRVRATIYNVPPDTTIELRWAAAGEQGTVQGGRELRFIDVGVLTDWAAPLNKEITYSVLVAGEIQSTATTILESAQSWLQDPLHPDGGFPVSLNQLDAGFLTLDQSALKKGSHTAENTQTMVMGSAYPRYSGGRRQAPTGIELPLYTPDEKTSDDFLTMIKDAPILLFRTHKRLRPFPLLGYLAADIEEEPLDQDEGGAFTRWNLAGNLVQATLQAALSGFYTYQDVQDLLGGYTYGEVQAAARSTTYLDWQKNPLIFSNL